MRRLVALTIILATTTAVVVSTVRETRNRDWPPIVSPTPATVTPVEGTTRHGLIAHVDTRNRSLEIEVNGHQERIFWDDRTLITVAKHRAKIVGLGSRVYRLCGCSAERGSTSSQLDRGIATEPVVVRSGMLE